jgi:hypothetical protein
MKSARTAVDLLSWLLASVCLVPIAIVQSFRHPNFAFGFAAGVIATGAGIALIQAVIGRRRCRCRCMRRLDGSVIADLSQHIECPVHREEG